MAGVSLRHPGRRVTWLTDHSQEIIAAVDFLMTGF